MQLCDDSFMGAPLHPRALRSALNEAPFRDTLCSPRFYRIRSEGKTSGCEGARTSPVSWQMTSAYRETFVFPIEYSRVRPSEIHTRQASCSRHTVRFHNTGSIFKLSNNRSFVRSTLQVQDATQASAATARPSLKRPYARGRASCDYRDTRVDSERSLPVLHVHSCAIRCNTSHSTR
jgi:hypothetical protein